MAKKSFAAASTLRPVSMPRFTVDGVPIEVAFEEVPLDEVRLDPDNPRIRERLRLKGNTDPSPEDLQALIREVPEYNPLQANIRENKGLREPILILADGLVVEGNCRTVAFQVLRKAQASAEHWKRIPAYRLPADVKPRQIAVLLGQYHVKGKITWPAHEKAGHLHHMHKELKLSPAEIGTSLGLGETDVVRNIQAYEFMRNEVLPQLKRPAGGKGKADGLDKFSYVLEFFKGKKLEEFRSKPANAKQFAQLVAQGRIEGGANVRSLHKVLANPRATEVLKKEGFGKAIAVVGRSDPTADSKLFLLLKKTSKALSGMRGPELARLKAGQNEQNILRELHATLKGVADTAKVRLD